MSTQLRACPATFEWLSTPWRCFPLGGLAAVIFIASLIAGCASTPRSPFVGPDPSNPAARTSPVSGRSTVAPYVSRRPVDPVPWREQNQRVAPPTTPEP